MLYQIEGFYESAIMECHIVDRRPNELVEINLLFHGDVMPIVLISSCLTNRCVGSR